MNKRFSEEQIIVFLQEPEAWLDLCRRHGFSEASYWRRKIFSGELTFVGVGLSPCLSNMEACG